MWRNGKGKGREERRGGRRGDDMRGVVGGREARGRGGIYSYYIGIRDVRGGRMVMWMVLVEGGSVHGRRGGEPGNRSGSEVWRELGSGRRMMDREPGKGRMARAGWKEGIIGMDGEIRNRGMGWVETLLR